MIRKSYFICRCICALKMGADLQRQVRYTVCSIRVQNAQQTFALTDKARQTKGDPLMLFIRSRSRCRALKETTGGCEFCIITLLQTEKLIFIETQAITAFSQLVEPAGETAGLRVNVSVSFIFELLVCLKLRRIAPWLYCKDSCVRS